MDEGKIYWINTPYRVGRWADPFYKLNMNELNLNELRQLTRDLRSTFEHVTCINHGGCGKFAKYVKDNISNAKLYRMFYTRGSYEDWYNHRNGKIDHFVIKLGNIFYDSNGIKQPKIYQITTQSNPIHPLKLGRNDYIIFKYSWKRLDLLLQEDNWNPTFNHSINEDTMRSIIDKTLQSWDISLQPKTNSRII